MVSIIISEYKKTKHSIIPKLCFAFPLLTIFLSYVLGKEFFTIASYDWWDGIFIFLFTALLCSNFNRLEKTGTNYKLIDSSPISAEKVWIAKITVLSGYVVITNLWLSFLVYTTSLGMGFLGISQVVPLTALDNLLAGIMLSIATLWQIPFLLLLAHLLGFFTPVLMSATGFALSVLADKSYWYLLPWTWGKRMMMIYAKVQPNGLPLEIPIPAKTTTAVVTLAGVLFLALLTLVTSKMFRYRRENK